MEHRTFIPPVRTLMGPGPSDVHPRVLEAMGRPTIGHLDPEFVRLMDNIKDLLQKALVTKNNITFPLSGPGTAGMELLLSNILEPNEEILICINGVFGGRMRDLAKKLGGKVVALEEEWGKVIQPEKLKKALDENPNVKMVAMVHAETSTGALSDMAQLCQIAKEKGCLTLVDAVTSFAGSPLKVDDWKIDALYSGSQKCLSAPPGLSPLTLSEEIFEKVKKRKSPIPSWFLDLNLILGYWGKGETDGKARTYHHTAPVNALYGFHESLLILHEEGVENSWVRHQKNHELLIEGLQEQGFSPFVAPRDRIPQLNTVSLPETWQEQEGEMRAWLLKEYDLEIGAGLGPLAKKVWRIGLMGHASRPKNVYFCLEALKELKKAFKK